MDPRDPAPNTNPPPTYPRPPVPPANPRPAVATPAEVTDIDVIVRAAKMMQAQCDGVDRWQRLSADVRAQWIESVLPIAAALADRPATAEVMENAETVARKFHEAYESLAPSFGYETRRETREFDPASPNGRLMIAVCAALAAQPSAVGVPEGKYADVLGPFVAMMERELHANAGKGDRPGWLAMDRKTALLEIYYHLAKLQKAAKDDDKDGICEYAADVANMSMMLVDVCGLLAAAPEMPHA